jgi:tetratricopeptide (TPR) repeat protein
MNHPPEDDLVAWAEEAGGDDRELLVHLLDCAACREWVRRRLTAAPGAAARPPHRPAAACTGRAEQEGAATLAAELLAHPPGRREVLVANSDRFRTLALAEALTAAAEERYGDAGEMEALARLALSVADGLASDLYGERRIADARGRAWATVGRALRLQNDLAGAERALEEAGRLLAGTADPGEEAGYLQSLAALRKDQRRFLDAEELLERAAGLCEEAADEERGARVLTSLGSLHLARGAPEAAVAPLLEAMRLVDPLGDPRTALCIRHDLALCLVETGRAGEAERLFADTAALYEAHCDDGMLHRRRWLGALLAAAGGHDDEAASALDALAEELAAAGQPYDAAVAALDLAAVYARQGRNAELKALARRLAPLFSAHGIHREGVTALAFFMQAAERERASPEVVERVGGFLKRARLDTALRFRSG